MSKFFYHLTTDTRLPAIEREGLAPQFCKDAEYYGVIREALYLGNILTALEHCEVAEDRLGGDMVLLRIDGRDIDEGSLSPDDYNIQGFLPGGYIEDSRLASYTRWQDVPWRTCFDVCGAVCYSKNIPPDKLTLMKFRDGCWHAERKLGFPSSDDAPTSRLLSPRL